MDNKKCYICGTDMIETTTSIKAGWGKYKLTIDGVKAFKCPKCGEEIFTNEEANMIQELGKDLYHIDANERPNLLNVSETADLLRISNQSVYNMLKDGRLKAVKTGREWRFKRSDIESVLHYDNSNKSVK
jgi:excisionase family DNA binding protein/YgiT-type zinc finger domain-containing protein